eukprot:1838623-Amphidinium_carterae.1
MPDAYRHVPVHPDHLHTNIVAVQHPNTHQWHFRCVFAMLFGFASAVIQFSRWSSWIEAVSRRLLHVMLSMYVDDASLMDVSTAKGESQALVSTFMTLLGAPFAKERNDRT